MYTVWLKEEKKAYLKPDIINKYNVLNLLPLWFRGLQYYHNINNIYLPPKSSCEVVNYGADTLIL